MTEGGVPLDSKVQKLVILFVFDRMAIPLSENTLLDICSAENNWVPYMECKQYLSELIDTNLLYRVPKSDCINITQDGVSCLAMFFSRIPSSLRDDINLFVRDNRMRFKKRQSYFCDYSKNADGTYTVIMRIMDGMFAFPFILLSILLMTVLGDGLFNVILAIGIADVPRFARTVRGQVIILKNEEYCAVEKVLGASGFRILIHHIMPNAISPIIVYGTLSMASAILSESALGFLGLGVITPEPSWGNILRAGKDLMNTAPHIAAISGGFIMVTVLAFNLFGDGVRDVLDPKMKK